ncbi:MAG: DUF2267 domain-containing protein [Anaeromyxobacter sp.]
MAGSPDPHAGADFGPLVDALAREGLPRRTEAVRAVEAVACALAGRLADPAFEPLRELLPEPFRGRLLACERHAQAGARPPGGGAEQFYAAVAEDSGVPEERAEEVEPTARAVFAALRAQLDEDQAEEVAAQLPSELLPLWRRPS